MTRSFFTGKQSALAGYKAKLSGVSLTALAALGIAPAASAQDADAVSPPSDQLSVGSLDGVQSVTQLADGSVEVTLNSGDVVVLAADDVTVIGDAVYASEAVLDAAGLTSAAAGAAGPSNAVLIGAGALAAGGLGLALSGGGDDGGSAPAPAPVAMNAAPQFSAPLLQTSAAENQTTAATPGATDTDGDTLSYSLSGTDASLFSIDSGTGVIAFLDAPDFETPADANGDNVFTVTVTASDGQASATQTVEITVTSVNEAPEIAEIAPVELSENGTTVLTVEGSDVDGDTLSYSLSGADAALFAVDAATGAVTFIEAPDFEAPGDAGADNVYDITVTASDGTLSVDRDVTITVTDANDAPVLTSAAAVTVEENQTAVLSATAEDEDADTLSYSLSGADAALFAVDAATGEISFLAAPDFEAPGDADGDNVYDLVIAASDGEATTEQALAVTVSDVNDAPVITSTQSVTVDENTTAVLTAAAEDADGDTLSYSLSGTDSALFSIDAATGAIAFIDAPDFEMPGDADADNVYDVVLTAADADASVDQALAITVADVDDTPPDAPVILSIGLVNAFMSETNGDGGFFQFLPAVTGTAEAGSTVELFDGETSLGTTVAAADGSFLLAVPLRAIGEDGLSVQATDAAGNVSDAGTLTDQFGIGAAEILADVEVEIDVQELGASQGFSVVDGNGDFLFPSVANVGDVNNDGFDDVIAVSSRSDFGAENSGLAALLFGGPDGFGEIIDGRAVVDIAALGAQDGVLIAGMGEDDRLIESSRVGDFNGDGIDDFVLGAPGRAQDGLDGEAYIVFGSQDGFGAVDNLGRAVLDLSSLTPDQGVAFSGGGTTQDLGLSVSDAGDINGDGLADLLVSDPNFNNDFGAVFVVYGTEGTLPLTEIDGQSVFDLSGLNSEQGLLVTGGAAPRFLGLGIDELGDVNGDGLDDFIVGDPFSTGPNGEFIAGSSYIVFGSAANPGTPDESGLPVLELGDLSADQGVTLFVTGNMANTFGYSVTGAGDFNGDGITDIAISAIDRLEGIDGRVFVVYGDEDGFGDDDGAGGLALDVTTLGSDDGLVISAFGVRELGLTLDSLGDLNSDGFSDLLIGSSGDAFSGSAVTFVVYGGPDGAQPDDAGRSSLDLSDLSILTGFSLVSGDLNDALTGRASSASDVNGDGVTDIILGSLDGAFVLFGGRSQGESETLALVAENTTAAFVATSLGEGTIFTLEGADAELFTIDAQTGLVSFVDAQDIEGLYDIDDLAELVLDADDVDDLEDLAFELSVTATNGTLTTSQDVAVLLTDVNEFAPVFTTPDTLVSSGTVFVVQAEDADLGPVAFLGDRDSQFFGGREVFGDAIEYTIVGGADAQAFTIEGGSDAFAQFGILRLTPGTDGTAPADADGDGVYIVEVAASDGELLTTQTLSLSLVEGGQAPVFTSPEAFTIDEFDTQATLQISAEDPDGAQLQYRIVDSTLPDGFLFDIDPFTGVLSVAAPLSIARPSDFNSDNVYEVQIQASDATDSTLQTVEISLNDIEFAPELLSETEFTVDERAGFGEAIVLRDLDLDELTASITGGADAALFEITDEFSGFGTDLRLFGFEAVDGVFDFEMPTDADGDNVYEVEVTYSDGMTDIAQLLTVSVEDVFESANAPIFTSADSLTVNEGERFVIDIDATDADGEELSFFISGGEDEFEFFIDSETGELQFSNRVRFNAPDSFDDNTYTVEVTADDGTFNQTVQTLTIQVQDIDVLPTLDLPERFSTFENDDLSFSFRITDEFDNPMLDFIIRGPDAALFDAQTFFSTTGFVSGQLRLADIPDFEMPIDADGDNIYEIEIAVTQDDVEAFVQTFELTVIDVFESPNAPVFVSPDSIVVDEGQSSLLFVQATDADDEMPTYSITGGPDAFRFDIDQDTGELTFDEFRTTRFSEFGDNTYTLEITADDGSTNQTVQTLTVEVRDANVAPTLDVSDTVTFQENNLVILFVNARDNFDFDPVTLSVRGDDASFFSVTPNSFAEITMNISPDFENPLDANGDNVYEIEVVASDGVNETAQAVSVVITDFFESPNAPVFTTPDMFTVDEGIFIVATVNASDADGETPTYEIVGGADSSRFDINFRTGELSTFDGIIANTSDDGDSIFEVIVSANDSSGNVTLQTLNIEIVDIDVVPTLSGNFDVTIEENSFPGFFDLSFGAEERIDDQELTITLSGPDVGVYVVEESSSFTQFATLRLSIEETFDFENPEDANGDNIYELTISATDGVNVVSEAFTLEVTDVFESANAPVFTNPDTVMVDEGETFVVQLAADDADGETPTFDIVGGDDRFQFTLDRDTQELSFRNPVTFDTFGGNSYTVVVEADDGTTNITQQTITVDVNDVDVTPILSVSSSAASAEGETVFEGDFLRVSFNADGIDQEQDITVSLVGEDADLFRIDTNFDFGSEISGSITPSRTLDFEMPADADMDNVYSFDLVASDGVNTATQTLTVNIADVAETGSQPVFTSPVRFEIDEGETFVGALSATDADGDIVTFELRRFTRDNSSFELGGENGDELSFNFAPQVFRSEVRTFTAEVLAVDGTGNQSFQIITIDVNNVNAPPVLTIDNSLDGNVAEGALNTGVTVTGEDTVDFDNVSFTLSGADAELFEFGLVFEAGEFAQSTIFFIDAPDFEAPQDADGDNVYDVTVELSDGFDTVTEDIAITVTDGPDPSDNAPVFVTPANQSALESEEFSVALEATDADGDAVAYAITGGDDSSEFEVTSDGDLISRFPLEAMSFDFNGDDIYEVEVTASDGFNETAQLFFVEVEDVNFPPILSANDGFVMEGDTFTGAFVTGEDMFDFEDNLTLDLSGPDGDFFILDILSDSPGLIDGEVNFLDAPVFASPQDANGDNVYEVTLTLSDGENTVTEDITITVEEAPPIMAEAKAGNAALASFAVEDDGTVDLDAGPSALSVDDVLALGTASVASNAGDAAAVVFDAAAEALEMQFAADLLMLQDDGAVIDS